MKRRRDALKGEGTLFDGLGSGPAESAPAALPAEIHATVDPLDLTAEQRTAADLSCNRVISASAGTGKTYTMTALYLRLLLEKNLRPAQIVAVTFTEKAAHELRAQLVRKISSVLQGAHLERCLRELPFAPIQTIHAFCTSLLSHAGARRGVPAGFGVLDEEDSRELLDGALTETAAELLESRADPVFEELAREWQVTGGHGHGLVPVGRSLAGALRTRGWSAQNLIPTAAAPPVEELRRQLEGVFEKVKDLPEKGQESARRSLRGFRELPHAIQDWSAGRETLLRCFALASKTDGEPYQWAVGIWGDLQQALLLAHAPLRAALARFLAQALERYRLEKLRRGALDFDDLLLEARTLLDAEPEIMEPYRFVIIDEFQDTNPLQKEVLFRVAFPPSGVPRREDVRLAIVGDVKQSIYRFRGAEVGLMQEALQTPALQAAPLCENFRSRRQVIQWINSFCACSLWPAAGQAQEAGASRALSYSAEHVLRESEKVAGRHAWNGPPGELLVAAESEGHAKAPVERQRWQQALAIARRIRTLVAESSSSARLALTAGFQPLEQPRVWEKEPQRLRAAVRYGDIAILAHSLRHLRAPLELALTKFGIPFRMLKGVSFFTRQEVLDLLNLLACIADPSDHAALIGYLRSPWVHLSDGAIFRLLHGPHAAALGSPREVLAQRISMHAAQGLDAIDAARFLAGAALLARLRAGLGRITAAEMIDIACAETGFLGILALQPQGEVAVAAVRRLIEYSRSFEARGRNTLADFVAWLRQRADAEWEDPGQGGGPDLTPDLPEAPDAVRVGTIHSAKGLEFPVTILMDIGSKHRTGHAPAHLYARGVAGPGLGLSAGLAREGLKARGDALHEEAVQAEREAGLGESRRLLYVALTRARDYLILCGECPKNSKTTWRSWIDRHAAQSQSAAALSGLVPVPMDHPGLRAARPAAPAAPVEFKAGAYRISDLGLEPPANQADHSTPPTLPFHGGKEALAQIRTLLTQVGSPPSRACGSEWTAEVSVTELADFLSCPRRHAYRRAGFEGLQPVAEEDADRGAALDDAPERHAGCVSDLARALGTAAHAALEAAFTAGRMAVAEPAWRASLALAGEDADTPRAREVAVCVEGLLAGDWARTVLALPPEKRFAERPFRWRVELPRGRAVILSGTLDLLAGAGTAGKGKWQVVDYKLSAPEGAPARETLARYAWQVGMYALAASTLLGEQSANVHPALLFLLGGQAQPTPLPRLAFAPTLPAALHEAELRLALNFWLEARARLVAEGPEALPKAAWVPGAEAAVPRGPVRCDAEGCPFVSRCFPVASAAT